VPLDICAFIVSKDGTNARSLDLPRAPTLFGLLTGIRGHGEPLFAERGRIASANPEVSSAFDEQMVFGESHLEAAEFRQVLDAWAEPNAHIRTPYALAHESMRADDHFVFAFLG
jgi:hypothetical protein